MVENADIVAKSIVRRAEKWKSLGRLARKLKYQKPPVHLLVGDYETAHRLIVENKPRKNGSRDGIRVQT